MDRRAKKWEILLLRNYPPPPCSTCNLSCSLASIASLLSLSDSRAWRYLRRGGRKGESEKRETQGCSFASAALRTLKRFLQPTAQQPLLLAVVALTWTVCRLYSCIHRNVPIQAFRLIPYERTQLIWLLRSPLRSDNLQESYDLSEAASWHVLSVHVHNMIAILDQLNQQSPIGEISF